jgi:hypothetical protein
LDLAVEGKGALFTLAAGGPSALVTGRVALGTFGMVRGTRSLLLTGIFMTSLSGQIYLLSLVLILRLTKTPWNHEDAKVTKNIEKRWRKFDVNPSLRQAFLGALSALRGSILFCWSF